MNKLLNVGKGKRSYLAAAILGIIAVARYLELIDELTLNSIMTAAVGLGIFGLKRNGVK